MQRGQRKSGCIQELDWMRRKMVGHGAKDDGTAGGGKSSRKINLDMLHQGLPGRIGTETTNDNITPFTASLAVRRVIHPCGIKDIIVKTTNKQTKKNMKLANTLNTEPIYFGQKVKERS